MLNSWKSSSPMVRICSSLMSTTPDISHLMVSSGVDRIRLWFQMWVISELVAFSFIMMPGHLGVTRTVELITRHHWWPGLYNQVKEYVLHCDICQRTMVLHEKVPGLLQPLQIPEYRWQSVSTDSVTGLPENLNGQDAIVVFVDRLKKMVHLVPTTVKVMAQDYAHIFLREVYAKHGLPADIVSDRDSRFTSDSFREFCRVLQIEQNLSVADRPQTAGQTERMHQ